MGQPVPIDDLPASIVPDSDLPDGLRAFQETPGGAVTGITTPRRLGSRGSIDFGAVGGAGALGTAAGIFAPELLTGAAGALRQIPQGARVAPLLESAAIGAKAAGRTMTGLAGGISGLVSETSGQTAEAMGAGPTTAEITRFVTGGIAPELPGVMRFGIEKYLQAPALSVASKMRKETLKKVWQKFTQAPESLDEIERRHLASLVDDLRGETKPGDSAQTIYNILERGGQGKVSVGEQQARDLLFQASQAAEQEIQQTLKGPVAKSNAGIDRLRARGQDALSTAQLQRGNIGQDADASDIGNALRDVVVSRNQAALKARQTEYASDRAARDEVVTALEEKRKFVSSIPEFDALVADLSGNLTPGKRSPDVQKTYSKILSSIRNPEKDVFGQHKPTSFQALDDVRRQLGQVFEGAPPEGYEAISAGDARKYYNMISDIQKKFAGKPQETLLSKYSSATEEMRLFGSRAGQKLTALDKFDEDRFKVDPSALPRQFFNSKQGISDLIELTGDRNLVLQAAKDFTTNELRNLDVKGIESWMLKRRELLNVMPEVRDAVVKYKNILSQGEDIAGRTERAIKLHGSFQKRTMGEAERGAAGITREAERGAESIRGGAARESGVLMGKEYPVERVRTLIESGDPNQWRLAAPEILAAPGGKQMLADSVRQVMADRASKSTTGLSDFFTRKVRPALEHTNAMTPVEIQFIATRLEKIENMQIPEPQKLGIAKRFILQSLGGYAASVGARGGAAATSSLVDLIPQ